MGGLTPPRALSATDDREVFDCGRESLNGWFRRHAWRNHEAGVSRVSVVCDRSGGSIAGYVALGAAQIERDYLPKALQRNRPDAIPVILLGQLAVDRRYKGRGIARSLLVFTFRTAVKFSQDIGCFGVLTHPIDDEVRVFYRRFAFDDLPSDPKRAMIVRIAELRQNGF